MKKSLLITILVLTTSHFAFASSVIEDIAEDLFSPISALADCLKGRNGACRNPELLKVASVQFACKERLERDIIHEDYDNNTKYYTDTISYKLVVLLFDQEGAELSDSGYSIWEKSVTGRNYEAKDTTYNRAEINMAINELHTACNEKVGQYNLQLQSLLK